MTARIAYMALLVAALAAWWFGYREIVPFVQRVVGWPALVDSEALRVLFGHWFFWQLPGVLLCVAVWIVGARAGLLPTMRSLLGSGGSWRRVVVTGLIASALLLLITVGVGAAMGGRLGFHPNVPKIAGDVLSNFYEELVYRGLLFCAFYGAVAGNAFPREGRLHTAGMIAAMVGSSICFAAGHTQYALELRAFMAVMSIFVWALPMVRTRSLWAPYIVHMLGDVVGDSILKL